MSRHKLLPKGRALRNFAPIFAALGDETRLRLIAALCVGGAMSIAQLTSGTDITRQAITKHLDVLLAAGLVRDVKLGRERLWEFEPAPLGGAALTGGYRAATGLRAGEAQTRRGKLNQLPCSHSALQLPKNCYIIRAHFRFGLLGTRASA